MWQRSLQSICGQILYLMEQKAMTPTPQEALKPCPFDQGEARWHLTFIDNDDWGWVECLKCGASGRHNYRADAIAAWNTRSPSPEPSAEDVERVARAIYDASHKGLSNCYSWDDIWEPHQERNRERYYRDARAAIAAMHRASPEPSAEEIERMAAAMAQVIAKRHGHDRDDWLNDQRREEARAAYLAMHRASPPQE